MFDVLETYRSAWFFKDLVAGLVLATFLVPAGMGYAEASGLPAIHGLYATLGALLAYTIFGPSRILIVGPDSSLVPIVAATVIPLTAVSGERVALSAALGLMAGLICVLAGLFRLGFVSDLLSMPIRLGYVNGIALTLLVGQLPKLFGFRASGDNLIDQLGTFWTGVQDGRVHYIALTLGASALVFMFVQSKLAPKVPGILVAVAATMIAVPLFGLASSGISLVGRLPEGLPRLAFPAVPISTLPTLIGAAFAVALVTMADGSALSRTLATRDRRRVDPDQELVALGASNIASGFLLGTPVSASNTRTPVAEAAGAQTILAGFIGAVSVATLLLFAPGALSTLPSATLAAVVMVAAIRLIEVTQVVNLTKTRPGEFVVSLVTTSGVAVFGPIQGIGLAVVLALGSFIWRMWYPHSAELVDLEGDEGYHDIERHPEGHRIPGLIMFRFDAPLFFANADVFRQRVLSLVEAAPYSPRWVLVTAEPITDIDATAEEMISELCVELATVGVSLRFAELRGRVRELMAQNGVVDEIGPANFYRTAQQAVDAFRRESEADPG